MKENEPQPPGDASFQPTIDLREQLPTTESPEHQLAIRFADNPHAYVVNMLMLMGLSARAGKIANATGVDSQYILGQPSQTSYIRLLSKAYVYGQEKLAGVDTPSAEKFIYDSIHEVSPAHEDEPFLRILDSTLQKKRRLFIAKDHLEGYERRKLLVFDGIVRKAANRVFYSLTDAYYDKDLVPPNEWFDPEIIRQYTDPSYWERREENALLRDVMEGIRRAARYQRWIERFHQQHAEARP